MMFPRQAPPEDQAWRDLLNEHNRRMQDQLNRFRGRETDSRGDGFLAVFSTARLGAVDVGGP